MEYIKYKVKEKVIKKPKVDYEIKEENEIFIVRRIDTEYGCIIDIPSAFTSFVMKSGNSYNTRLKDARHICDFLNYTLGESNSGNEHFIDVEENGFSALNFSHAAQYLTECINERGNSYETIKSKEKSLIKFFKFLNSNNVTNVEIEKLVYVNKEGELKEATKSPFNSFENRVFFPAKIFNSNKIKNMESHIFNLFIKCCDELCPEIRLGIYLQTMGGLRIGEVVNCTINSLYIKKDDEFCSVDVLDNQNQLFKKSDLFFYSPDSCQVKKPRYNQVLLNPNGELEKIYLKHILLMNKRRNKNTPKEALFIGKKGNPMTGIEYKNRFYALKKYFLSKLEETSYSDFHKFSNRPWGTHIGRAIFTNYCIINGYCNTSDGKPSAVLLAKLRGDSSLEVSQRYIDEIPIRESRKRKINSLKSNIEAAITRERDGEY